MASPLPPPPDPGRPRPRRSQTEVRLWRIAAGVIAGRAVFTALDVSTSLRCGLTPDGLSATYGLAGLVLGLPLLAVPARLSGVPLVWAVIGAAAALAALGAALDGTALMVLLDRLHGLAPEPGPTDRGLSGPMADVRACGGAVMIEDGRLTEIGRRHLLLWEPLRHALAALPAGAVAWVIAFGRRAEIRNPRLRVP